MTEKDRQKKRCKKTRKKNLNSIQNLNAMTAAFLIYIFASLLIKIHGDTKYDYGMVIDAGSTHSSLYVYQFTDRVTSTNLPPQSEPIQIAESSSQGPVGDLQSQSESDILISV